MFYILIIVFICTLFFGMNLLPRIIELSHELHLYDVPDSRKVHKLPIPRLGGIVFLPAVIVTLSLLIVVMMRIGFTAEELLPDSSIQHLMAYICGVILLYGIGIYDDVHGVGYRVKFLVQIFSAAILCVSGLWIYNMHYIFFIESLPYWLGMPLTVFFVVYVTNAINLIDGIDGLASGLGIIALAVIAGLFVYLGQGHLAAMAVAFFGVLASFFYYNVFGTQHKTFMGDAGSLTLGYTLSFLILHFWQLNPVWNEHFHNVGIVALSTLIIPLFDVVRVMMSRLRDKRNPFLPDKNHIHHKLLRTGMSPRMTMVTLLMLSLLIIVINYFMAAYISQTVMLVVDMILFCAFHLIINFYIMKKEEKEGITWSRVF